jgi:GNAT superfamily N-acetyltransferase
MENITIRLMDIKDLDAVGDFIKNHFAQLEPINQAYKYEDENLRLVEPDNSWIVEYIESEASFVAEHDGNLVGVVLAKLIDDSRIDTLLENAEKSDSKKDREILKFMAYFEKKADYCKRLNVPNILFLFILSTHTNYLGRGIGGKLFKTVYENAKLKKHHGFAVDCSNYYTSRIAEKLGLPLVSSTTYDEYNQHIGEVMFDPVEPHSTIKSYGIKFE